MRRATGRVFVTLIYLANRVHAPMKDSGDLDGLVPSSPDSRYAIPRDVHYLKTSAAGRVLLSNVTNCSVIESSGFWPRRVSSNRS